MSHVREEEQIEQERDVPLTDLITRLVRRAIKIIREGGPRAWSRAAKVLYFQSGSAPITKETIRQLRDLHPHSDDKLADIQSNHAADIISVDPELLVKLIKKIDNGSAPGSWFLWIIPQAAC